ncbi:MAG: DUF952 domain-containing protein [Chloroflexota bacterium]
MSLIYHITSRTAADAARLSHEYRPESLEKEGFIHLSQRHQVSGVANSFYKGQTDLVILVVDETLLKSELKYEAPVHPTPSSSLPSTSPHFGGTEGGPTPHPELFPHLYGPLNFDAVVDIVALPANPDGTFRAAFL